MVPVPSGLISTLAASFMAPTPPVISTYTPTPLLGAELFVTGLCQRLVETCGVVAAVVGLTHRRGVGLVELGQQVPAPDLDRVEAHLVGEQIHGPLGGCCGLRPACAAVGDDRRGVRHHRHAVRLDVGDVVHGGGHAACEQGAEHGADLG